MLNSSTSATTSERRFVLEYRKTSDNCATDAVPHLQADLPLDIQLQMSSVTAITSAIIPRFFTGHQLNRCRIYITPYFFCHSLLMDVEPWVIRRSYIERRFSRGLHTTLLEFIRHLYGRCRTETSLPFLHT